MASNRSTILLFTYRSMFIKVWPRNEAIEMRRRADVSVDVGVVHADEEVRDRIRRRDFRQIGQLVAVRPNQPGRVHCEKKKYSLSNVLLSSVHHQTF